MRFDAARALHVAEQLWFDRLPWRAGSRRAADLVAAAFSESGYTVERVEVSGSPSLRNRRIALAWLGFGAGVGVNLVLLATDRAFLSRALALFAAILWWFTVSEFIDNIEWLAGELVRTSNVMGTRPGGFNAPVRVVFLSTLDVPPPMPRSLIRQRATSLLSAAFVALIGLNLVPWRFPRGFYVAFLVSFGAILLVFLVARVRPFPGDFGDDNRDGLGLLVELARTWPSDTDPLIDPWFVAAGGQLLDGEGLKDLARRLSEPTISKPTLVIGLWSLGRSTTISVVAPLPDVNDLALDAAQSLWVPYRDAMAMTVLNDVSPFGDDPAFVGLFGVPAGRSLPEVDPDALQRAAQLATEIALRWARRHPVTQGPGESLDRSSQNPG